MIGLWWDGLWVARDRLREALLAPLEELQRQAQAIVDSASDDLDAAEALARVVAQEAHAGRGWGLVGQRLGRSDDRHSVATAVMLAALGGRPAWDVADTPGTPTLGDILNKATGIEQALRDGIDDGSPWLKAPPDLDEHFASVYAAGASDLLRITAPISEATDEELDHVRDFAHTLIEAVVPWVAELEQLHGVDAGGIASMREMLSAARTADRILLVHWILTTRHLWLRNAPVEQS